MGYTKTIASFFSGYGGLEMGIRSALGGECRTIVFVEREAYAVANLVAKIEAGQLDAAPIHTDVTTFPYRKFRGLVDIACGGVPCQPHSVAGKRKGGNDERFLFDAFFDGLEEMQPGQIFIENVEGLLTSKMPDGSLCFNHIIERLEKMDYRVEAGLFTAAEVGAPHRRKRVFILGHSRQFSARNQIRRFGEGSTSSEEIVGAVKGDRFTDSSKIMGNAASEGFQRNRESEQFDDIQDAERGSREGRKELADTDQQGSQGREYSRKTKREDGQGRKSTYGLSRSIRWPSRPGQPQHDWEAPRVTEPQVGGKPYGAYTRVDELRLLGNGVVPQQAARAYKILSERLFRSPR